MKKILLAFTATSALLLSVFTNANAQVASTNTDKKSNDAFTAQNSSSITTSASAKSNKMAARAFKDFSKNFKNVDAAEWGVTAEGGFVATFDDNSIKNRAYYDNKGHWLFSMKTYDESKMPASVRHTVKTTYYDFKIIAVQEIETDGQTVYLVHIEDANSSKTIRVTDTDMDVIENFVH